MKGPWHVIILYESEVSCDIKSAHQRPSTWWLFVSIGWAQLKTKKCFYHIGAMMSSKNGDS